MISVMGSVGLLISRGALGEKPKTGGSPEAGLKRTVETTTVIATMFEFMVACFDYFSQNLVQEFHKLFSEVLVADFHDPL